MTEGTQVWSRNYMLYIYICTCFNHQAEKNNTKSNLQIPWQDLQCGIFLEREPHIFFGYPNIMCSYPSEDGMHGGYCTDWKKTKLLGTKYHHQKSIRFEPASNLSLRSILYVICGSKSINFFHLLPVFVAQMRRIIVVECCVDVSK